MGRIVSATICLTVSLLGIIGSRRPAAQQADTDNVLSEGVGG